MKKLLLITTILSATLLAGCWNKVTTNSEQKDFPIETFTSQRLGVSFNYIDDGVYNAPTLTLSGDTITVWPHSLQIIKKDPMISAEEFVLSLTTGMKSDCAYKIETGAVMLWYETITLINISTGQIQPNNDYHCSNRYDNDYQRTHFIYNPRISGKILFFNGWQEGSSRGTYELPRWATIKIF